VRRQEPRELRTALGRVVGGLSGGSGGDIVPILSCWDEVVGEVVAAHARPRVLRDSMLLVEVDEPAWATQLRYLRGEISAGLNDRLGRDVVRSIELSVRKPQQSRSRGPRSV